MLRNFAKGVHKRVKFWKKVSEELNIPEDFEGKNKKSNEKDPKLILRIINPRRLNLEAFAKLLIGSSLSLIAMSTILMPQEDYSMASHQIEKNKHDVQQLEQNHKVFKLREMKKEAPAETKDSS